MFDVAVAGGGPVGSRVAARLAARGYHVAVFEKKPQPGLKFCCTGIISQECVNRFSIPATVVYKTVSSAIFVSPSGYSIRVSCPDTLACIVNRPAFDRYLVNEAQKQGVEYFFDSPVEKINLRDNGVVLEIGGVRACNVDARVVVLASGFGSALIKGIGLTAPALCTGGAQIEAELNGVEDVEVYFDQEIAPGSFSWIVPTQGGKGLVGLLARKSPGLFLRKWFGKLASNNKVVPGDYRVNYGGIFLKPARRTYGERIVIVGDAAGQVKPTTGGGLYFGLLCADLAAFTIDRAFSRKDFSEKILSGYEREWKKLLLKELTLEYYARRFYEHLSNRRIDEIFIRLKSSGILDDIIRKEKLSFDWHGKLLLKAIRQGAFSGLKRISRIFSF